MIKVVRISKTDHAQCEAEKPPSTETPSRSIHSRALSLSEDFSVNVVSGVRFAPLLRSPSMKTIIPSQIWQPSIHCTYPQRFKDSIKEIILCSHAPTLQPPKIVVEATNINLASMLPKDLWIKILSYTHRSWFEEPYKVDEAFLRQRLKQEQKAAKEAKIMCAEAERRMRIAERERDGYKLLARRWQLRLRAALSETNKISQNTGSTRGSENSRVEDQLLMLDDLTEAAVSLFNNDNFFLRMSSIAAGQRFRHVSQHESSDDGVDDENVDAYSNDDADETNMDIESDDEDNHNNSNSNEMDGTSSEEDNSEDYATVAASPQTSNSSFYRRVSESLESHSFFP